MSARPTAQRARRGVALLEALIALVILGTVGASLLALTAQAVRTVHLAVEAERSVSTAGALLHAAALWPRTELDQRLGDRPQGALLMRIDRPRPQSYVVTLRDSATGEVILSTSLYRREDTRALR